MSPERSGKREQSVYGAAIVIVILFAIWAGISVGKTHWESASYRVERCKKFRREFFDSCLAAEPRYRCEVQWAQLGDKVFDSPPDAPWSDQLDCSKEFE